LNPVTNILLCIPCGKTTTQTLVPTEHGASWHCHVCENTRLGFSKEDMLKIVANRIFGVPQEPAAIEVPKNLKVYLKHNGDSADEMEAHPNAVEAHISVTGELPKVGNPMFAKGAHPMVAIPYGEVVRVETS
jgi:hypothetical protein